MRKIVILSLLAFTIVYWKSEIVQLLEQNIYFEKLSNLYKNTVEEKILEQTKDIMGFPNLIIEKNKNNEPKESESNNTQANNKLTLNENNVEKVLLENIENIPIDMDMVNSMKDNFNLISIDDKFAIANIALSNFSISEMNAWKNKLYDGISMEEREEFFQLVFTRLSEKEIIKLKDLAKKYLDQITIEDKDKFTGLVNKYSD